MIAYERTEKVTITLDGFSEVNTMMAALRFARDYIEALETGRLQETGYPAIDGENLRENVKKLTHHISDTVFEARRNIVSNGGKL